MSAHPTSLAAWADVLDALPRRLIAGRSYLSSLEEGTRYVMLSDESARDLANVLRAAHPLVQPVQDLGTPQ